MTEFYPSYPFNFLKVLKLTCLILLLIVSVSIANAQNLVPNFSFEQMDSCPDSQDQIEYATGWKKYSEPITTPDYFNACAPYISGYSVPKSGYCNQIPHRGCDGYAGLVVFDPNGYREHIGIQLTEPLTVGQKYFFSFYTVMGEFSNGENHYGVPSNNIGMRLSTIDYNPSSPSPIDNFAHLYSSAIIDDSTNWIRISGSIIADSAYNYLIMGNFFDNNNTDTVNYSCGTCLNLGSYFLIDDICVSSDSLLANGGIDALSCTTTVNEISSDEQLSVFPNPTNRLVTVWVQSSLSNEIYITDIYGKICYNENVNGKSSTTLDLTLYSSGIYILNIINQNEKTTISKKIIKL